MLAGMFARKALRHNDRSSGLHVARTYVGHKLCRLLAKVDTEQWRDRRRKAYVASENPYK